MIDKVPIQNYNKLYDEYKKQKELAKYFHALIVNHCIDCLPNDNYREFCAKGKALTEAIDI